MKRMRLAVIGVGYLGRIHARLARDFPGWQLCGVVDPQPQARQAVQTELGVPAYGDLSALAGQVDAAIVATPSATHYTVASQLLRQGVHLLVEKPLTLNVGDAQDLIHLADQHQCVLHVGHVERFNPALVALRPHLPRPELVLAQRVGSFTGRSLDVGAVLDLMIHDLDVVLAFVAAPVVSVDAVGIPVLSASEDIANARLRFANGCVANLTASRVSAERLRKIRVFSSAPEPAYVSLDYRAQAGYLYRLARADEPSSSLFKKLLAARDSTVVSEFGGKRIVREPVPITREEPLKLELRSFVDCVLARRQPVVSGEAAKRALDLAFEITRQIRAGLSRA